ncbi:MAG: peptide chain release factor 1 [Candidatus Palauibacterales bacterium]|nr:peptide chain release factor 1 [Candidatus Palauibacterales bacterium]
MTDTQELLRQRTLEVIERHDELAQKMADPDVLGDSDRLREAAKEHSDLEQAVEVGRRYLRLLDELEQAQELLDDEDDEEIVEMARAEVDELESRIDALQDRLRRLLVPKDPHADRAAVLEIRAGAGGDEAALFAGDLHRMYSRYVADRGWTMEVVSSNRGSAGGFKEIISVVRGDDAYGTLRYESGVHRVQRVPETESSGRIHTSAASVAVLPEAREVDVEIDPSEITVDVFRASGPGGQSVNTTDSAVRITHEPTGLVVSCQDEKSQHKNRSRAMQVLRSRLLDLRIQQQEKKREAKRRQQVGSGDRSAKIRTYNFPQNRVTDHRINLTMHRLEEILDGDLEELIDALRVAYAEERLQEAVGE